MKRALALLFGLRISVRLVLAIVLLIAIAWAGMLVEASRAQRQAAIEQAKDFAESAHQMTLAGLTAMLITGTGGQRELFLDQIKRSNNILALRVIRGEVVNRQYGKGTADEAPSDPLEYQVLDKGRPEFEIRGTGQGEYLKAVLPAIAGRDVLGKNCLGCHAVGEGAVLGAVSMEISLKKVHAAVADFGIQVTGVAFLIFIPLILLIYFAVQRTVIAPLGEMSRGLDRLAEDQIDLDARLPVRGSDEIAEAAASFNRVLQRVAEMSKDARIAQDVFDHTQEGICVTDRNACIIMVNPAFTKTTGYQPQEAIGMNPKMLQSGKHDKSFYEAFWQSLQITGAWQGEVWNKRKNGEVYPEWLNISSVRDDRDEAEYYIAVFSDITERKRNEDLITHQAQHDALTGLPNRYLFRDRAEQALAVARRHGGRLLAVMFLDLDRFKLVNDTLGHAVGDRLLKDVARRVRGSVREEDTVARFGGDEFTVLLPEIASVSDAEALAKRILAATELPYRLAGRDLFVTTSIGISFFPGDGNDAETLMKNADTAMYHVKEQGRASYCLYSAALSAHTMQQMQFEGDLHNALRHGELRLFYQPQMNLERKQYVGVEVQVRWQHPTRGLVPQAEFLHLAEETGLIIPIGEWVLEMASSQVALWQRAGNPPLTLSVDLSPRQFYYDGLADMIESRLELAGLRASALELCISENLVMQDVDRSVGVLQALNAIGVRLAITDFGTGLHASASGLKRLPIHTLKIHSAYVKELAADPRGFALLAGMVGEAHGPELKVVATGVETGDQFDLLRKMHCDIAQGPYFGTPLSADEAGDMFGHSTDGEQVVDRPGGSTTY